MTRMLTVYRFTSWLFSTGFRFDFTLSVCALRNLFLNPYVIPCNTTWFVLRKACWTHSPWKYPVKRSLLLCFCLLSEFFDEFEKKTFWKFKKEQHQRSGNCWRPPRTRFSALHSQGTEIHENIKTNFKILKFVILNSFSKNLFFQFYRACPLWKGGGK